jgi:tRNA(Ile)-lysidine synthase
VKDREAFLLSPVKEENAEEKTYLIQPDDREILNIPFRIEISTTTYRSGEWKPLPDRNRAYLDKDKLHFPLTLRKWQAGDKFIPFGMKGFQKLSDFFNNQKISKPEKEKIWLLLSGENIVWVVNHRIDDRFKVDEETEIVYILSGSYPPKK